MISRPLFKQSAKANVGIWSFVTFVTCFMLAIVILVLGNLNVGSIRDSMMDMFVKDAIESSIEKESMTYYHMTDSALLNFDSTSQNFTLFANAYKQARQNIYENYPQMRAEEADLQAKQTQNQLYCLHFDVVWKI